MNHEDVESIGSVLFPLSSRDYESVKEDADDFAVAYFIAKGLHGVNCPIAHYERNCAIDNMLLHTVPDLLPEARHYIEISIAGNYEDSSLHGG